MSATPQQIDEYVEMNRQQMLQTAQELVKALSEPLTTGWQFININAAQGILGLCWENIIRNKPLKEFPFSQ